MAFRLCTIGCGGQSRTAHGPSHARYAREHPDVELAACCDLNGDLAERYRTQFGYARAYTDLDAMLAAGRPDAIFLIVPVERTASLGARLLARGLPLLLEKPPGLTLAECDQLLAAAGDTPHQVAFNRRFAPLIREAGRRRPAGLQHVRYEMIRVNRRDPDFSTTAVHGLDAVRFLADSDYRRVRFHFQPLPQFGPTVANAYLDAELTSGATAHLAFCPVAGAVIERATLHGHGSTILVDIPMWNGHDGRGRLVVSESGAVTGDWPGTAFSDGPAMFEESGFYAETASFLDDLRAGRRPACNLAATRQSVAVMEAYRERRTEFVAQG